MTQHLRNTLAALVLLAGFIWSLPMDTGHTDANPESSAYSAAYRARFEITSYPGELAQADSRPLGIAPAWWADATVALVAALAETESPNAVLTEDTLRIRALVADKPATLSRLQSLHQSLPAMTLVDIQLIEFDAGTTAATICEQQFAAFSHGPVAFEESGTDMRTSAYPVLDGVVALADACRAATVTITGHTDSSGNEDWNQRLSLARAEAVAAYLDSRGIAADRLVAVGAGSSVPVADNATRYGRSINRRIDIRFTGSPD